MPRGEKSAYTSKQKRKAEHIEEGYEHKGVSHKEAERRAWATVNKQDGGGKKTNRRSSSTRAKSTTKRSTKGSSRSKASHSKGKSRR